MGLAESSAEEEASSYALSLPGGRGDEHAVRRLGHRQCLHMADGCSLISNGKEFDCI